MPESYSPVIYNTNYIAIDKWQFNPAINFNNLNFWCVCVLIFNGDYIIYYFEKKWKRER